ncbi:MAG TPA: hypothetical protein VMS60_05080 [Solirubrobacterales bacterium]|nr:hypothetical protein [Solirubrobacterales bacterium]
MLGIDRLRQKLTFSNAISLMALFFALGGTVYAAAKIDGKTIRKGSIPANRLKAESLTGAQINESSLSAVPRATSAQEATTAASAERAASADRADVAAKADKATEAARAQTATEAEHAKKADHAAVAEGVGTLDSVTAGLYILRCAEGAVKAAATVDASGAVPTITGFSCTGENKLAIGRVPGGEPGEYELRVDGLEGQALGNPTAIGSALKRDTAVSISGAGPVFRVKVFNTATETRLPNESFRVAFF